MSMQKKRARLDLKPKTPVPAIFRVLRFTGFFVLPFVFVFVFAGRFLEQRLLLDRKFLATPVFGIPYLILLVEMLSIIVFALFRHRIANPGRLMEIRLLIDEKQTRLC
jgi:hypothetical protein